MSLDSLGAVAGVALAGSLATERLVVLAKTMVPWFGRSRPDVAPTWGSEEQFRRLAVNAVAVGSSLVTAYLISDGGEIVIPNGPPLHWIVFALMISGGSAFWTSIVAYASSVKDVQRNLATSTPTAAVHGEQTVSLQIAPPRPTPRVVTEL